MVLDVRALRPSDEDAFLEAVASFRDSNPTWEFAFQFNEVGNFSDYVVKLERQRQGEDLPPRWLPHTYLVGVLGDTIVGRVSIRHGLDDFLRRVAGHIGYGVVAEYRGRGYAKELLCAALEEARTLGMERVLLTCNASNRASARVIEIHGGVLENVVRGDDLPEPKRRYWIEL